MNIAYTERARQGEDYRLLQQHAEQLTEILQLTQEPITAEWDRLEGERGRTQHVLKLRDVSDEVDGAFTMEELRDPLRVRDRLYRLVRDLLRIVSDKQHRKVMELVSRL